MGDLAEAAALTLQLRAAPLEVLLRSEPSVALRCTHTWPVLTALVTKFVVLSVLQDKDEQTRLEMKHRKEEDDLYRKFARQREEEDKRMKEEFRVSRSLESKLNRIYAKQSAHSNVNTIKRMRIAWPTCRLLLPSATVHGRDFREGCCY